METFRDRLTGGEVLVGTFVKLWGPHSIEILGQAGFDFIVLDQEHAPLDRAAIDIGLLAARAVCTTGLVRVPEPSPSAVLAALDCGAVGVVVPHVASAAEARRIAAACRYRGGTRGFSGSPRAADYGRVAMADHVQKSDDATVFIAMIEDEAALASIDEMLAVEGLDGILIGRADLAVSMGALSPRNEKLDDAVAGILQAALRAGKPAIMALGSPDQALFYRNLGASAFIVSSDQSFIRQAGAQAISKLSHLAGRPPATRRSGS